MLINFISILNSKKLFLLLIVAFLYHESIAQIPKDYDASVEIQAIGTTNGTVPFWMRANKFGSVPLSGASGTIIGRFSKDYEKLTLNDKIIENKKIVDWGFGFEGRANAGKNSNLQIIEAYVKGKLSIFQLKVGRTKDVMGFNGDTSLSSGNFSVSGNALGVPRIDLSIPNYWRIPIFGGLFSLKGNFVHGWLGKTQILDSIQAIPPSKQTFYIQDKNPISYLHQKSLYIRIGKQNWRLNLYGGINHQVYWGNEKAAYGSNFKLSPLKTFFYVATGKSYGSVGVPTSKIGNQIGSIDAGLDYAFDNFKIILYRQNFYDVGAISKLANIADGLNGIAIENLKYTQNNENFAWKKILFEFFYSKDQAGYPWSKKTKSGDEDYYNNFYYVDGWSYKGLGVGNPLITTKTSARSGQASSRFDYFINNRVIAIHLGFQGKFKEWSFLTKAVKSWNYGTFGTSIYGNSTGEIRSPQTANIFKQVQQFSFYLESEREIKNGYNIGFETAVDHGKLLNNSLGLSLKLSKSFK